MELSTVSSRICQQRSSSTDKIGSKHESSIGGLVAGIEPIVISASFDTGPKALAEDRLPLVKSVVGALLGAVRRLYNSLTKPEKLS